MNYQNGCLINNINSLNFINECGFNVSGIQRMFIAAYDKNLFSKLTVFNNQVIGIDYPIKFIEIIYNKANTKYSESYNATNKNYDQILDIDIINYDYAKRSGIDALIKSKIVIVYQNSNGKYFIAGEKSGLAIQQADMGTDVIGNKNGYILKYSGKADYMALGMSINLIEDMKNCDDLNGQLALPSLIYWLPYENCLVGQLSDFIDPV